MLMNMTMKKLMVVAFCILLTGCASYIPVGAFYNQGKQGIQDNNEPTPKTGRACINSFLAFVATGDASVEAAKRNGGITKVATIDYEVNNVLGFIGEYCTVVRGS